jgi:glucose-6-phosphate-specific signal transduction histidine kinase
MRRRDARFPHTEDHGPMAENEAAERFTRVLGVAALDLWSDLPQEIQQRLFERAVLAGHKTERDESLREQLAQFLHDHHERTAAR